VIVELLILAWILSEMSGPRPSPPATTTTTTTPPAVPPFPPPAPPVPPPATPPPATPPPATPPPATPPPAPPAAPATYKIAKGDTPFAVAQKFTGAGNRWKELLAVNPSLSTETIDVPTQTKAHPEGEMVRTTFVRPFDPGQVLTLPASWPPTP
jgi:hypothetical protein